MTQSPSKTVTFLFTDIEGSMRLGEDDPGPMKRHSPRSTERGVVAAPFADHDGAGT